MQRIQRVHLLAATLTLVGVAGVVYVLMGLLSSPVTGAASADPLLFSIGEVPAPLAMPSPFAGDPDWIPPDNRPGSGDAETPLGTKQQGGSMPEVDSGPEIAVATPVPTTGATSNGIRQTTSQGIEPTDISIPKIDVHAKIVQVGTTSSGAMGTPERYADVGWWSLGAEPGETGRAVLAGHIDSPRGAAVFIRLDELEPGDEIIVGDGLSELRYIVRGAAVYRADAAPVDDIFGPSTERELILITCGGWFDRGSASYLHRRVVFAVLADDYIEQAGTKVPAEER
jgi:sortase A